MGVHDYVDFVQRNDQCITPLALYLNTNPPSSDEEDEMEGSSFGNTEATLVRVPGHFTKREILSWPLSRLAQFPIEQVDGSKTSNGLSRSYHWDGWYFEHLRGYDDQLSNSVNWWDQSIWQSPDRPGEWLVNFEPEAYSVFVLQRFPAGSEKPLAECISWYYYRQCYQNRSRPLPKTKQQAFDGLVDSSFANLWQFDRQRRTMPQLPASHQQLVSLVNGSALSGSFHCYQLDSDSISRCNGITSTRLRTLLGDELLLNPPMVRVTWPDQPASGQVAIVPRLVYDSLRSANKEEQQGKYQIQLLPIIPNIHSQVKGLDGGCLQCGELTEPWNSLCSDHLELDAAQLISQAEQQAAQLAADWSAQLGYLDGDAPPELEMPKQLTVTLPSGDVVRCSPD